MARQRAMTYIESVPGIDREAIAIWGDSYSAAEVIVVGAVDERPAAVVAQIPAIGARLPPPDPDGALFTALSDTVRDGSIDGRPQDTTGPLRSCPPTNWGRRHCSHRSRRSGGSSTTAAATARDGRIA